MKLKKLKREALKHTDNSFFEGEREIEDETLKKYVKSGETEVDYEELGEVLEEAMSEFKEGENNIDADVAPRIHQIFDLTRREAAQPAVWNYLSIKFCPEFVRHRWKSCSEDRFVADRTLMENAFSRLWWVAELTERNGTYQHTRIALREGNSEIAQSVVTDNNFSHYKALPRHAIEAVENEDNDVAAKYGEILNRRFAVRLLESLNEEELKDLTEAVKHMAKQQIGKETESKSSKLLNYIRR
jgi:hypothetical protein